MASCIDGRSAVDTSALTGESLPADKGPGDEVLAGCVVQNGTLTVEAKKVAKQTVAGQVIDLTAQALKDKAPLERYADRLARYFLPAVLALALLTFVGNVFIQLNSTVPPGGAKPTLRAAAKVAVYPALAVLVVACPVCADPRDARGGDRRARPARGDGRAHQGRLGTRTARRRDRVRVRQDRHAHRREARTRRRGSARRRDAGATACDRGGRGTGERAPARPRDPRGGARQGTDRSPQSADFQAHPGGGVTATVGGAAVVVGTRRLLEEQGIAVPPEAVAALEQLDATGQTSLLVAANGAILGVIGARDKVRPEAAQVLADLRALGIAPIALLTGDRAAVAKAVAEQVPVTEVHAELLPAQKAEWSSAD